MIFRTDLPYEILQNVFENLDSLRDVLQCQLVCRNWSSPAQERFYKNVTLIKNKLSTLEKLIVQLTESPHSLGRFVKSLDLKLLLFHYKNRNEAMEVFTNLIKLCPNLEILSAQDGCDSPYYQIFQQQSSNLLQLQKIPVPINHEHLEDYVATALFYRSTLKYVFLGDLVNSVTSTTESTALYYSLKERLNEFPRLTNLEIRSVGYQNIFDLEHTIDSCPSSLHTLMLSACQPAAEFMTWHTIHNISSVVQHPNVRTFIGDNIMFTDVSINCFMHKLPGLQYLNLKRLVKKNYSMGIQPRSKLSRAVMTRFFKYISSMHCFELCGSIIGRRMLKAVNIFVKSTFDTNNLTVKVRHTEYFNQDTHNYPSLSGTRKTIPRNHKLVGTTNANPEANTLEMCYLFDSGLMKLPHLQIINFLGEDIKHLCINAYAGTDYLRYGHKFVEETRNYYEESNYHTAMLQGLNQVFSVCRSLETLLLFDTYCFYGHTELSVKNRSIKKLEIQKSPIHYQRLSQLSYCLPSLKNLVIKDYFLVGYIHHKAQSGAIYFIDMPHTL